MLALERLSDPATAQSLTPADRAYIEWQGGWYRTARDVQMPPDPDEQAAWLKRNADNLLHGADLQAPWTDMGYMAGRGFGKALTLSTPIPTPSGWTTMGALRDGDVVFDERGLPCRVLKVHAPYAPASLYRVLFSDGTHLVADGEHLWVTWSALDRKRLNRTGARAFPSDWAADPSRVRTTDQIARTLTRGNRGDRNHCIPVAPPLCTPNTILPIDPWVLGYWLGNGSNRDATLSCHEDDAAQVFDSIRAAGYDVSPRSLAREGYALGLTAELRALGVLHNKHVPPAYLRAGPGQRASLLAGLLDSDGHCHAETGHVEFCSTDEALAWGVLELARSLGQKPVLAAGRALLRGADHGAKYRVTWRPTVNPFALPRKAAAYREPGAQSLRNLHRMIVSVEPVALGTVRCITVDSPNAMYLAGEGMIPTHNTRVGAEWLGRIAYECTEGLPYGVIAPTQNDVRMTCFEGQSGLLNIIPADCVAKYSADDLRITLTNGATIRGFSAEKAERLRGPEHHCMWGDEIAAWGRDAEYTLDMALMGLRIGQHPRFLWTSTPKPNALVRKLTAPAPSRLVVRGATYDNRANLAKAFFDNVAKYEGTKLGRQEIYGELIDPEEAGIIRRSWMKLWPASKPLPRLDWIIMSLDTAFTEKTVDKQGDPDPTACSVWGVFQHERRANIILLDCWEEHLGMPDLIRKVKRELNTAYGDDEDEALIKPMYGGNKPLTSGRKPDILLIEDKGSGISLRQMLSEAGIEAYAYNPGRADKLSRLHIVSPVFAQRRVWLPESNKTPGQPRTWAEPLVGQLCSFAGEGSIKHDDLLDTTTQALRLALDKGMLRLVSDEKVRKAAEDDEARRSSKPRSNPYSQ